MTQTEIARAIGAGEASTVAQWESGVNVPEGIRRERLIELLEGRLWPELRAAALADDGLPAAWNRAARWYRRASRERQPRETVGVVVAAILEYLRSAESAEALRQRYCQHDGEWVLGVARRHALGEQYRADLRRIEDAAYGLRWAELTLGRQFDLRRSLAPQVPLLLLDGGPGQATG